MAAGALQPEPCVFCELARTPRCRSRCSASSINQPHGRGCFPRFPHMHRYTSRRCTQPASTRCAGRPMSSASRWRQPPPTDRSLCSPTSQTAPGMRTRCSAAGLGQEGQVFVQGGCRSTQRRGGRQPRAAATRCCLAAAATVLRVLRVLPADPPDACAARSWMAATPWAVPPCPGPPPRPRAP